MEAEFFLLKIFSDCQRAATHAKRMTVMIGDMNFVIEITAPGRL